MPQPFGTPHCKFRLGRTSATALPSAKDPGSKRDRTVERPANFVAPFRLTLGVRFALFQYPEINVCFDASFALKVLKFSALLLIVSLSIELLHELEVPRCVGDSSDERCRALY